MAEDYGALADGETCKESPGGARGNTLSGGPFISAASSGSVLDEDRDGTTGQFVVGNKLGFKPGQSGNPGGRPKSFGARLLAKLDETHGNKDLYDSLVAGLLEDAQSDDPTVRLQSRKELLARIFPVIAKHELTGDQDGKIEFSWQSTPTPTNSEDSDDSVQG